MLGVGVGEGDAVGVGSEAVLQPLPPTANATTSRTHMATIADIRNDHLPNDLYGPWSLMYASQRKKSTAGTEPMHFGRNNSHAAKKPSFPHVYFCVGR